MVSSLMALHDGVILTPWNLECNNGDTCIFTGSFFLDEITAELEIS
jgi:hypothetical protein